jgi:sulfur carrier protein
MKITLNNRQEKLPQEEVTVGELLKIKNFTYKMLVVKVNQRIVRKHEYGSAMIKDGDDVTVLHLVTGG